MIDLDDLIMEARKCAPGDDDTKLAVIVHRLADALEAATEGDYHEGLEEGIKIGRAERDAALAAVDRVRALHTPGKIIDVWGKSRSQADDFLVCVECTDPDNWWIAHPCATVAALDGAPEPGLSESERLEIDGTPYVFSPDSLSYQIDGWVHDLGLPGDSMLREFGVQDGSYFEDPTVLSEKLQEVTIAWLEEHGYRRGGAPEPEVQP